jgi:hypothetical protein
LARARNVEDGEGTVRGAYEAVNGAGISAVSSDLARLVDAFGMSAVGGRVERDDLVLSAL